MNRLLILGSLLGGSVGFMMLGPGFADDHSLKEQIALGLVARVMLSTLFGVRIQTLVGVALRMVLLAVFWRLAASLLRIVRLR